MTAAQRDRAPEVGPHTGSDPISLRQRAFELAWYFVTAGFAFVEACGRTVSMLIAAARWTVVDIVGLRFSWAEFVTQAWFMVRVSAPPAVFISIPFGVTTIIQVSGLTTQIGATSVAGAAGGLGIIGQAAPMVAALLLGGAAGSAIASDLGARTIREEIDAMRVMGLDPTRRLVAPRLAAMVAVAPLLCILVMIVGISTTFVINVTVMHGAPGSFLLSLSAFSSSLDVAIALGKAVVFGVAVVAVACYCGLTARGGPRGVANAVNAAVVVGMVTAFLLNLLMTQLLSMFHPPRIG
ncbi:ABC transporter permease [Nocardia sp. CDC159]|uniref:ABC transporter permease n=1 Tax=Nocardia pulmonis TaxID=2951408 RepID=A0A9X2E5H2_9NOCA|nr:MULTISPECIES: ABC transporter permease [Nocardia]MCM6774006.1 ABC transporter permease [Nocardia pulmonis]MCM6786893.1 ABC transporter permease [Nocardia sp. CDC159]